MHNPLYAEQLKHRAAKYDSRKLWSEVFI